MKFNLVLALLTLVSLTFSCTSKIKKGAAADEVNISINDIWVLEKIGDKDINTQLPPRQKRPQIELHVKEMKIQGNDGCNSIGGSIEKISAKELKFGPLMGTKMACPDMETPARFNVALEQTRQYTIKGLKLLLLDVRGETLLQFQKVD